MNSSYNYNYSGTYGSEQIDPAMAGLGLAVFGGILLFILVIAIIVYVYMAICLMKIAKKTGTEQAWLAWIPIANIVLMLMIAKKPIWWIILYFIPLVNIVISILVWMEISKAVGKPDWLGILMIVPIANLIIPGYLAFSKSEVLVDTQPPIVPAT